MSFIVPFAISMLVAWSFLGVLFYTRISDDITNRWKKHLARLVSGPIVWFFCALAYVIDWLAFLDNVYTKFASWLRKP